MAYGAKAPQAMVPAGASDGARRAPSLAPADQPINFNSF